MTIIKPSKGRLLLNVGVINMLILCSPMLVLALFIDDPHYIGSIKTALPMLFMIALGISQLRSKSAMDDIEIHSEHITGPGPFKFNPNKRSRVSRSFEQRAKQPLTERFGIVIFGDKSQEHIRMVRYLYQPDEFKMLLLKLRQPNE